MFTGKTNYQYCKVGRASGYYSKDFPKFRDGFAYVNDGFKYTKYDKQGKKCGTISENELPEYRLICEDEFGIFELYTVHMGLKGKDGTVLIKPYYSLIGTYDANVIVQVSNGVVLVMLVEFSEYNYNNEVIYHYGYADLKGHDTFSEEIKEKVNKSREGFYQKLREEESLQEEEEKKRLMEEGPDWLQGAWRVELTDDYGNHLGYMYEVFNHGTSKSYIDGSLLIEREYTVLDDKIIYDKGFFRLDFVKQIVISANGKEMKKVSSTPSYTPSVTSSSSYSSSRSNSNRSSSSSRGYRFSSPHDVIGWLTGKTFYSDGVSLRVRTDGIYINNQCVSFAPTVERWESWKALIRANTPTGGRVSLLVDPINGQVTDSSGDVFTLR